jgi:uncharacterized membrane protein YkvA (DUF1232 family)
MATDRGTAAVVGRSGEDDAVRILLGVGAGLFVAWVALLVALVVARPQGATLTDAVRLLPDLVGLVRRLAGDRTLPRSTRTGLVVLAGYLVVPFDVVPDFLPVIGYADDAIVVALALRWVVRVSGADAVVRHWRGSDAGLEIVRRLAGR